MSQTLEPLILDLLEWIGPHARPYTEVIEAWRTSCPRLPVWEEANDRGFIEQRHEQGRGTFVKVSALGAEHVRRERGLRLEDDGVRNDASGVQSRGSSRA